MSIRERRNAALKSSISINSIRDAVSSLGDGLRNLQKESNQIVDQQQKTNVFKRALIRDDNKFFARRRENVLRKEREDEIEASNIQGSTKRQGTILQKSTRGFLGRMLDLVGIVIIGWFTTKLLPILPKLAGLISLVIKLLSVGKIFTDAIATFIVDMQEGISKQFSKIPRKNELEDTQKEVIKSLEETSNRANIINLDFFRLSFGARKPEVFGLDTNKGGFGESDAYKSAGIEFDEEGNMILPEEEQPSEEDNQKKIDEAEKLVNASTSEILKNVDGIIEQQKDSEGDDGSENNDQEQFTAENTLDVSQFVKIGSRTDEDESIKSNDNFEKKATDADNKIISYFKNIFGFDPKTDKVTNENDSKNNMQSAMKEFMTASKFTVPSVVNEVNDIKENLFGKEENGQKIFGSGLFDNKIMVSKLPLNADKIKQNRKRDKIIIVKPDNNNQNSGGGVNSSGGGGRPNVAVNNDKNELKKVMLLNLK